MQIKIEMAEPKWSLVAVQGGREARRQAAKSRPGPARGGYAPLVFLPVNQFSMAMLYGRARRITAKTGGFRPGQKKNVIAWLQANSPTLASISSQGMAGSIPKLLKKKKKEQVAAAYTAYAELYYTPAVA